MAENRISSGNYYVVICFPIAVSTHNQIVTESTIALSNMPLKLPFTELYYYILWNNLMVLSLFITPH